jgi:hypothetical protein
MSKSYVYMIERIDGLCYIGITIDPTKRFKAHLRSDRFSVGIKSTTIIKECATYKEAEDYEEYYINKFDTYNNGLNLTRTGKGMSDCKFNTLGHKYSETSRMKMSESAKRRGPNSVGYKHSAETKDRYSKIRKGKFWGKGKKIPDDIALDIYESYDKDTLSFDNNFIKRYLKKTQRGLIDHLEFEDMISPNGRPLSKLKLYGEHYAEIYGVTSQAITSIINSKGNRCELASN